jgi:hypothetical protein
MELSIYTSYDDGLYLMLVTVNSKENAYAYVDRALLTRDER